MGKVIEIVDRLLFSSAFNKLISVSHKPAIGEESILKSINFSALDYLKSRFDYGGGGVLVNEFSSHGVK